MYEASGGALNDFSSGSPIVALLEGQAFAQAELLFWANRLPDSILTEWIGPFLGAQRRLGNSSTVTLRFEINPQNTPFVITEGFIVATNPNLTSGVTVEFVTNSTLVIPAGSTFGEVVASSVTTGRVTNVEENTIVRFSEPLSNLISVTNEQPATGGEDFETIDEVKERFFTLIRRRNPVSAEDWSDFMEDLLGQGTLTTVIPRRSHFSQFDRFEDFLISNGHFSIFSLNADGTELTNAQIQAAQRIIDLNTPVAVDGHLYPTQLFPVDIDIEIQYDPSMPYANSLQTLSFQLRETARRVLLPGSVFPIDYSPSVSDFESAFTENFPSTFNVPNRYVDPDVLNVRAYSIPKDLTQDDFRGAEVKSFFAGNLIEEGSLIQDSGNLYRALSSFTPNPSTKEYYVDTDNLVMRPIKLLEAGIFQRSEVVAVSDGLGSFDLHVVLRQITFVPGSDINVAVANAIADGDLSAAKSFSAWTVGNSYTSLSGTNYDPEIILAQQTDFPTDVFQPAQIDSETLFVRPGWFVFVVENDFTRSQNTANFSTAQTFGLISNTPETILSLTTATTYNPGDYFETNPITTAPCPSDPFDSFVDPLEGALQVTYEVLKTFTYTPDIGQTVRDSLIQLESENAIRRVITVDYSNIEFRYTTRFRIGEYFNFTNLQGDSSTFISLLGFTPYTNNLSVLSSQNWIFEVTDIPTTVTPRDIFRFNPGDTAIFLQEGGRFFSFTANDYVTPILNLTTYEVNNIFNSSILSETKKFFELNYTYEDIIQDDESFYRVIRPSTPLTGTVRDLELSGKILKIVLKNECSDRIRNPLSTGISANTLGFFDVLLTPTGVSQSSTRFVWGENGTLENTSNLLPYGDGTLAL